MPPKRKDTKKNKLGENDVLDPSPSVPVALPQTAAPSRQRSTRSATAQVADTSDQESVPVPAARKPRRSKEEIAADNAKAEAKRAEKAAEKEARAKAVAAAKEATAQKKRDAAAAKEATAQKKRDEAATKLMKLNELEQMEEKMLQDSIKESSSISYAAQRSATASRRSSQNAARLLPQQGNESEEEELIESGQDDTSDEGDAPLVKTKKQSQPASKSLSERASQALVAQNHESEDALSDQDDESEAESALSDQDVADDPPVRAKTLPQSAAKSLSIKRTQEETLDIADQGSADGQYEPPIKTKKASQAATRIQSKSKKKSTGHSVNDDGFDVQSDIQDALDMNQDIPVNKQMSIAEVKRTSQATLKKASLIAIARQRRESEVEEFMDTDMDDTELPAATYVTVSPPKSKMRAPTAVKEARPLATDNESDMTLVAEQKGRGRISASIPVIPKTRKASSKHTSNEEDSQATVFAKKQKIFLTTPSDDTDIVIDEEISDFFVKPNVEIKEKVTYGVASNGFVMSGDRVGESADSTHTINITDGFKGRLLDSKIKERVDAGKRCTERLKPAPQNENFLKIPGPSRLSLRPLRIETRLPSATDSERGPSSAETVRSESPWSGISNAGSEFDAPSRAASVEPNSDGRDKDSTKAIRITRETSVKVHLKAEQDDSKDAVALKNKKGEPKARFVMDDLPINRRRFRQRLLPTYCEIMMAQDDPFDTHEESILPRLQRIYDAVFPNQWMEITETGPLKVLIDQRYMEIRRKFADYAVTLLEEFFEQDENSDELFIAAYVQRALSRKETGYPEFIWGNFYDEEFLKDNVRWGLLCSPFAVKVLANYFFEVDTAVDLDPPLENIKNPFGAVALALCAVERGLSFWRSGVYYEEKDKKKKMKLRFSGDNYGEATQYYLKIVKSLREDQWMTLVNEVGDAFEMLKAKRKNTCAEVEDLTGDDESDTGEVLKLSQLMDLDQGYRRRK